LILELLVRPVARFSGSVALGLKEQKADKTSVSYFANPNS
jgi:hypothetical protein